MNDQFHLFRCVRCGEYRVPAGYFDRFLTPETREQLAARADAPGAVLAFYDCCPACQPDGQSKAALNVLWPKPPLHVRLWHLLANRMERTAPRRRMIEQHERAGS
jgi:hypothetical protein